FLTRCLRCSIIFFLDITKEHIILLIMQQSTNSIHFPYTTLFRSHWRPENFAGYPSLVGQTQYRKIWPLYPINPGLAGNLPLCCVDRKSTRLNSSHVKISYAVFCLKKKIKNIVEKK